MSTSFRTIFAGLAFAGLMAAGYACSDTNGGSSRTGTGGDTSSGAGGAGTGTTGTTSSGTTSSGTTSSGSTTTGAGGGATTTSTGSAGGTTSTTTGMGGTGSGTGGAGGSGNNVACGSNGQPYTGPLLGRCSPMSCTDRNCGTSIGKGGFITLDDFETLAPTAPVTTGTINMTWASYDGRNGGWHQYSDPAAMASMILAPAGGGGSPDSVQAIHYLGGRGSNGATLALTLGGAMASNEAGCYDASAYAGISFWIKGNLAAGNTQVKFNVHSPVSEPAMTGGACMSGCYDHFSVIVNIPATWTRVKVPWSDLKRQSCTVSNPPTPPNFQPEKQILAISFQQVNPAQGFDFWIDDVRFDLEDTAAQTTKTFGAIVTQPTFNVMFPAPVAPYTYAGFTAAVQSHGSALAGTGTLLDRRVEAAAFLAHVMQETGQLLTAREKCQFTCSMNLVTNCIGDELTRPCTSGNTYYGRGAMQLTLQANYSAAQAAGFAGIVANPDLVATNVDFAFGTAVWFWTTPQSAKGICHDAIMNQHDFGQTTNIINGGIECVAGNPQQAKRIGWFKTFCAALGVNPRGKLTCP